MLRIHFSLPYYAPDPEVTIYWVGTLNGESLVLPMSPGEDRATWQMHLAREGAETLEMVYSYQIERAGQLVRVEPPSSPHTLRLVKGSVEEAVIEDYWIEADPEHRYSELPLAPLLGRLPMGQLRMPSFSTDAREVFLLPTCRAYEGKLLLVGAVPSLGAWEVEQGIPLTLTRQGYLLQFPNHDASEYKLLQRKPSGEVLWEEGINRYYQPSDTPHFTFRTLPIPKFAGAGEETHKSLTGTAVPLFSLRGSDTQGIGDFGAALELLEWLEQEGQSVLQLLPIYDTTFSHTAADSYPYSAITTYGLHPNYLCLSRLPGYQEATERAEWERRGRALDALEAIDYVGVTRFKREVAEVLFDRWYEGSSQDPRKWKGMKKDKEWQKFVTNEEEQLLPYALFCAIRDRYPERAVEQFPPYKEVLAGWHQTKSYLGESLERSVAKYQFLQYHLYKQLSCLRDEAHQKGILLKGDLPIGVSRDSVDVWVAPHLFCLYKEAGSPPDAFSSTGQDWAFPTYDWEAMAQEDYEWWRRRLKTMSHHFDALRIDHILGFFRIWSIPLGTSDAAMGWYVPARGYQQEEVAGVEALCNRDEEGAYHPPLEPSQHPAFAQLDEEGRQRIATLTHRYYFEDNESLWTATALQRLTNILRASDMLLCAEDLGVLPKGIAEVLRSLEILSLEVIRMPKQLGRDFVLPQDIPQLSVLTTSTHDIPSLRGWWQQLTSEEREALAQAYHFEEEVSPRGLVKALLAAHLSVLLVLPIQDWAVLSGFGSEVAPEEEQINKPHDPHHIWDYRLPKGQIPPSH